MEDSEDICLNITTSPAKPEITKTGKKGQKKRNHEPDAENDHSFKKISRRSNDLSKEVHSKRRSQEQLHEQSDSDDVVSSDECEVNKYEKHRSSFFGSNLDTPVISQRTVKPVSEPVFSSEEFKDLSIHKFMISNLEQHHGLTQLTTVQKKAIPILLTGKDALVRSQTGSGKTLAYAIPIVEALQKLQPKINRSSGVRALIILPTRELALQTYEWFVKLCKTFTWLVPGYLVGGEKRKAEKARIRKGITILIGTPGRLLDHVEQTKNLQLDKVCYLVLDEADRLLDMGYEQAVSAVISALKTQRIEYEKCYQSAATPLQTVLLSATLTPDVERLAGLTLKEPAYIDAATAEEIDSKSLEVVIPESLDQWYTLTPAKLRLVTLAGFIVGKCQFSEHRKMLIFCATQDMVDFHKDLLEFVLGGHDKKLKKKDNDSVDDEEEDEDNDDDYDIEQEYQNDEPEEKVIDIKFFKLHGNMSQKERTDVFITFREAESGVLLCTDVAARGLDLPQVDWIVQYTAPCTVSDYVHRVGRTARIGTTGSSIIFLGYSEANFIGQLQEQRIKIQEETMESSLAHLRSSNVATAKKWKKAKPESVEEAATRMQLRFEWAVLDSKELHESACKAYTSWVRFYASYPKEVKDVFCFKKLHLGHYAKSFALRDAPTHITGIGKKQGHGRPEKPKNRLTRTQEKPPKQNKIPSNAFLQKKTREIALSEYASGL